MIIFGGIEFPQYCGECEHFETSCDGLYRIKCRLTGDILALNDDDRNLHLVVNSRPDTCPYNMWFDVGRKVLDNVFDIIDDRSDAEELKQKILDKIYVRN